MMSFVEQLRAALERGETTIATEDVKQLLALTEQLARRYVALSDFHDSVPSLIHPGQHSALEMSTNPDSHAFFGLLGKLISARQEFAHAEAGRFRYACRCCGLFTLMEDPTTRDGEFCTVCSWEHDMHDDPRGPNGCTLSEARENFNRHFTMHEAESKFSI